LVGGVIEKICFANPAGFFGLALPADSAAERPKRAGTEREAEAVARRSAP